MTGGRGIASAVLLVALAACGDSSTGPGSAGSENLQSATLATHVTKTQAAGMALASGVALQPVTDVDMYSVSYKTTAGGIISATGAVWLPSGPGPWPILVYMHGTSLPKANAPSSLSNQEGQAAGALFGTSGYIVVLPDYVGMGGGTGRPLWQHAATEATAGEDLIRAARELATQKHVKFSDQLFITGYSQGGHAAMALHRRVQERGEFRVTAAAPMAGAYDISGTARGMIEGNPSYPPAVFYTAYLLAVYNEIYHFAPSLSAIFVAPYDAVAADLLTGNYGMSEISARLPATPQALLQPAFLQAVQASTSHPLWAALRDNDVYDWKPAVPVRLFHGGADRDVPIQNAITAAAAMKARGADVQLVNVGATHDHSTAVLPSFTGALSFFQGFRSN